MAEADDVMEALKKEAVDLVWKTLYPRILLCFVGCVCVCLVTWFCIWGGEEFEPRIWITGDCTNGGGVSKFEVYQRRAYIRRCSEEIGNFWAQQAWGEGGTVF